MATDGQCFSRRFLYIGICRACVLLVNACLRGKKAVVKRILPSISCSRLYSLLCPYNNRFASRRAFHFARILVTSTTKQGGMASEMVGDEQCFLPRKLSYLQQERRNAFFRECRKRGSEK